MKKDEFTFCCFYANFMPNDFECKKNARKTIGAVAVVERYRYFINLLCIYDIIRAKECNNAEGE